MNNCCDKCSGRIEDENGFGRNYGCLKEDCSCHSPQNTATDKEFDEFLLGSIDNGIQIPRTRKEWLDFIHRREQEVRKEVVEYCEKEIQKVEGEEIHKLEMHEILKEALSTTKNV